MVKPWTMFSIRIFVSGATIWHWSYSDSCEIQMWQGATSRSSLGVHVSDSIKEPEYADFSTGNFGWKLISRFCQIPLKTANALWALLIRWLISRLQLLSGVMLDTRNRWVLRLRRSLIMKLKVRRIIPNALQIGIMWRNFVLKEYVYWSLNSLGCNL